MTTSGGHDDDTVGDLAGEARRLTDAVQQWARRTLPPAAEQAGSDCQWCPVCQLAGVLRGDNPELTERIAEAGTALVTAFRTLLDSAAAHPAHAGQHAAQDPAPSSESPRVQRIPLTDPPDDA